ncbi:hypothetical protein QJS10_CPA05g01083 [Acorus calamus]|uniref:Uncharacterized protein n=1 Tax=Acorus calamus TaxID=4465 RepID=A0AAV9EV60_ACOCL|nr:hypothetical protein QJS10_CPA05g01083 [Acorus calamus]
MEGSWGWGFAGEWIESNCRFDFRSSCAILSGKIFLSQQQHDSSSDNAGDSSSASSAAVVAAVNGHVSLDMVSILDQNLLPKPLTTADLSPAPMHGSCLRVAYQGVPDAYNEAATGKAYPNYEAIPCDQFEVAL